MREDGQRVCSILGKTPGADRILLYDDMEGVLKWGFIEGFTLQSCAKRDLSAYAGNYGLSVGGIVVVPDGWAWGYAGRYFPCCGLGVVCTSCIFRSRGVNTTKGFRLYVRFVFGGYRYDGFIQYDFGAADPCWHQVELVMNLFTGKYGKCSIDGQDLGMTGLGLVKLPDVGGDRAAVLVGAASDVARMRYIDCDLVLVRTI
jgi:hypothetical protein